MSKRHSLYQTPLFEARQRNNEMDTESLKLVDNLQVSAEATSIIDVVLHQESDILALSMQRKLRSVQRQFNELHEELYKKGGIKPANAAIDEVSKLLFLKFHTEQYPDYQLQCGIGKGKLFADIYNATYMKINGKKAVRELQDAFQEISVLPCYLSYLNDESQTIFPYQEPLRLEHPDVLAMAIETLTALSLSVSDDSMIGNPQKQWEAFSDQDILGSAYDIFLRGKYDSAGGLGTYLTPNQVVDCMVKMAFCHISNEQLWAKSDAKGGQGENLPAFLIGDTCCGTGRFLVRALAEVRNRILSSPEKDNKEKLEWLTQMKKTSFFGADQSASSIEKARINFLLFGEPHAQLLTVEDSILDERIDRLVGKFDVILTNPPFGEGKYTTQAGLEKMRRHDIDLQLGWSWKTGQSKKKKLQRADPALLFIDRNLHLLKAGGLLFIVLPDGILEPSYEYVHKYLLDKAILRAVVSLPRDTFAITGTVAKTSFLCLQKIGKESQKQSTAFMAVANHVGYLKKGSVEVPDPLGNELSIIATVYESFVRQPASRQREDLSHSPMIVGVPQCELQDALTPQTYHSDRRRAEQSVVATHKESRYLHELAWLVKAQQAMRTEKTKYFISVLHVDENSNVDWNAAKTYTPSSRGIRCQANDIIFSCLNPAKVRVAVIPEDVEGEVLCSTEFAILRMKQQSPYFVALALRTSTSQRQILPLARGTSSSRRRVRNEDLLQIILPYPEFPMRQELSTKFHEVLEMTRKALLNNHELLYVLEKSQEFPH